MSRSRPSESVQNPCSRWFEWNGGEGRVEFYDKALEARVKVELPFTFLLLDRLGTVGGWHDPSESGIYANEVKDTRSGVLVVKSFKGGPIAEGVYRGIKDKVNASGGSFVASCYIAFRNEAGELALGNIRFKGAALKAWMDFEKEHRAHLYTKAIRVVGAEEGKKGRITFYAPTFALATVEQATSDQAAALDVTLQTFLDAYLTRTTTEQASQVSRQHDDAEAGAQPPAPLYGVDDPITVDDIPF